MSKKLNEYNLSGEYGIGYTSKGTEFYFDIEDYNKIKNFTWYIGKDGYVVEKYKKIMTRMHRLVMKLNKDNPIKVDHIDRKRNDNRKMNLRFATSSKNGMNKGLQSNNSTGFVGVSWDKKNNKWYTAIKINQKVVFIGRFSDIDIAITERLKAEIKYFGKEFAPQRNLFEEYGIAQEKQLNNNLVC